MGRLLTIACTVMGLVSSAMIIAAVSSALQLDDSEQKVAVFMRRQGRAEKHRELERLAGNIVAQGFKIIILRKRAEGAGSAVRQKRWGGRGVPHTAPGEPGPALPLRRAWALDTRRAARRITLKQLCGRFRRVRREFNRYVAGLHHPMPHNVAMGNKLRDMELMIGGLFDQKRGGRGTSLL
eukprot:gene9384-21033_t